MFHTLLGLPSQFTNWCADALEQCLRSTGEEVLVVRASTLEDLQPVITQAPANSKVLLISDAPSPELITVIERSGGPVSISLVPPPVSAAHIHAQEVPQLEATQLVAVRCCLLHELICNPAVQVLSDPSSLGGHDVVLALAQYHGISLSNDVFYAVGNELLASNQTALNGAGLESAFAVSLSSFQPLLERKAVSRLDWPAELFTCDRTPAGPASGRLGMMGPGRVFIWGPYQHIPEGKWRVEADFSVYDNFSGNILKIDVFQNGTSDPVRVEGKWSPPPKGRFQANMQFEAGDITTPTEIRFWMLEGVIEGFFELHGVTLNRLPTTASSQLSTDHSNDAKGFPQPTFTDLNAT